MGFIIYDINNLPVAEFRRDGTAIQYAYDNNGQRATKLVGSAYTWYVPGADGKTEVLYNNSTTNPTYNVFGNDNTGQVRRTGPALTRYYYLKDHLGTNRMTVQGDYITLADDFSGTLSQWTTVLGNGFSIQSGELVGSGAGSDNVMINSSAATFGDGVVSSDVKDFADGNDANIVIRYQDPNNYYMVQAYASQIIIFKKYAGTYYAQASVYVSPDFNGGFFHLQATVIGGTFTVYWKGQQVLTWTDTSPWISGKVGVRQCLGRNIHWDNFSAITYTTGTVVAYDDFYPFGQLMDGRSALIGQPDARYKFTGKERDSETGWDYFGARYYDSRVGRWLSVDPLAERYRSINPYNYVGNNSLAFVDPKGLDTLWFDRYGSYTGKRTEDKTGNFYASVVDALGKTTRVLQFLDPSDAESIASTRYPDGKLTPNPHGNGDHFTIYGLDLSFENSIDKSINANIKMVDLMCSLTNDPLQKLGATLGYIASQSLGLGQMDYLHVIDGRLNSSVAAIGGMLYNNADAGNFMWGKTMAGLGFSPWQAQLAAQSYEVLHNHQFDQNTDQIAIREGARSYKK
jgi:RHS repeat-associated protein